MLPENQFYIDTKGRLKYRDTCLRVEVSTWLLKKGDCYYDHSKEYWDVIPEREVTGLIRANLIIDGVSQKLCLAQVS